MQEGLVTAAGTTYELPQPFLVLATQNPIEQEGTYPLPEAQLDRFMFNILIDYPGEDEEVEVIARTTTPPNPRWKPWSTVPKSPLWPASCAPCRPPNRWCAMPCA